MRPDSPKPGPPTTGAQDQNRADTASFAPRDAGSPTAPPSHPPALPTITLPTGGGIRGIDEKLTVGLATGTGTLSVPVPASPGRQGFGPNLSLSYESRACNGPFGLDWCLSASIRVATIVSHDLNTARTAGLRFPHTLKC